MIINCTKKLQEQLKIKPDVVEGDNPLLSWHGNLLIVNRRKTLVLVNDKNRYTIVLHGLKAKDFNKIDDVILHSIQYMFEQEGIQKDVIEQYIDSAREITFSKTKDRKLIARMNRACETLYYFETLLDSDTIFQPTLSLKLSRDLVGDGKKDYFYANEAMYKDLEEFTGKPTFQTKALEMKITLRLQSRNVFRKLIVPMYITFSEFHHVIQTAFGWQDSHLHEFYDFSNQKSNRALNPHHFAYNEEGYKPIANLVCHPEAFNHGDNSLPKKLDHTVLLSEYMPANVTYVYDFGDNWIHDIKVQRVMEDYDKNYPTCIEGEGNTPPEDVGGEGGYEVFLEIMEDVNHPDYKQMYAWSREQGFEDFDIKMVNRRLKDFE
ncbi:plasmid pRiA4b ORF-3 family protein [Paucisalibacillus globulus]|uniref:plasmid pRiA4b ORF-3 family protein n=1 Tax=Paucisalibacillus globulus TaxID=351095 RepID=UPI000BB84E39|nr:plasmid pRiA4b ORF-3 family protein [Paucisalibacillus globulus]